MVQRTEVVAGPRLTTQTDAELMMGLVAVALSRTSGHIAAMVLVLLRLVIEPDDG
jgi:hypothetical protein